MSTQSPVKPTLEQYRDQARKDWTARKAPKPADLDPYYEEAAKDLLPADLAKLGATFRELAPRWKSPIAERRAERQADPFQFMPALDAATDAALSASIERFGVLVPVVYDQRGNILDGHQRQRIATALGGIHADVVKPGGGAARTKQVKDDAEAFEIARTLNEDRRHLLDIDQRRALVADLREQGHSERAIAGALRISPATAHRDAAATASREAPAEPGVDELGAKRAAKRTAGLDGKSHPATKPAKPKAPKVEPDATTPADRRREFERIARERGVSMARLSGVAIDLLIASEAQPGGQPVLAIASRWVQATDDLLALDPGRNAPYTNLDAAVAELTVDQRAELRAAYGRSRSAANRLRDAVLAAEKATAA